MCTWALSVSSSCTCSGTGGKGLDLSLSFLVCRMEIEAAAASWGCWRRKQAVAGVHAPHSLGLAGAWDTCVCVSLGATGSPPCGGLGLRLPWNEPTPLYDASGPRYSPPPPGRSSSAAACPTSAPGSPLEAGRMAFSGGSPCHPPSPDRSCRRGSLRRHLEAEVQGFPIWLWEDGHACPRTGTAPQGVAGRGLGSRTGVQALGSPWATRPVVWGDFCDG